MNITTLRNICQTVNWKMKGAGKKLVLANPFPEGSIISIWLPDKILRLFT